MSRGSIWNRRMDTHADCGSWNRRLSVRESRAEPVLIVHDLKLGDSEGSVGLWMGQDTEGYFRNLSSSKQ
jgi:hypothetical protein